MINPKILTDIINKRLNVDIKSKSRKGWHSVGKRIFCVIMRKSDMSLDDIAEYLYGKKDHASVINHLKNHENQIEKYNDYSLLFYEIYSKFDNFDKKRVNVINELNDLYKQRIDLEIMIKNRENILKGYIVR